MQDILDIQDHSLDLDNNGVEKIKNLHKLDEIKSVFHIAAKKVKTSAILDETMIKILSRFFTIHPPGEYRGKLINSPFPYNKNQSSKEESINIPWYYLKKKDDFDLDSIIVWINPSSSPTTTKYNVYGTKLRFWMPIGFFLNDYTFLRYLALQRSHACDQHDMNWSTVFRDLKIGQGQYQTIKQFQQQEKQPLRCSADLSPRVQRIVENVFTITKDSSDGYGLCYKFQQKVKEGKIPPWRFSVWINPRQIGQHKKYIVYDYNNKNYKTIQQFSTDRAFLTYIAENYRGNDQTQRTWEQFFLRSASTASRERKRKQDKINALIRNLQQKYTPKELTEDKKHQIQKFCKNIITLTSSQLQSSTTPLTFQQLKQILQQQQTTPPS